jgi:hypothetical protein
MRRVLALPVALLLTSFVVGAETFAQQQSGTPAASGSTASPAAGGGATPADKTQSVEGKVKSWDAAGKVLTLEDGTQISIPAHVGVQADQLKPGADVKASFQEKDGQKVANSIEVK